MANDHTMIQMHSAMNTKAILDGIEDQCRLAGESEANYRVVQYDLADLQQAATKLDKLIQHLSMGRSITPPFLGTAWLRAVK